MPNNVGPVETITSEVTNVITYYIVTYYIVTYYVTSSEFGDRWRSNELALSIG